MCLNSKIHKLLLITTLINALMLCAARGDDSDVFIVDDVREGVAMYMEADGEWAPLLKNAKLVPGIKLKTMEDGTVVLLSRDSATWALSGIGELKDGSLKLEKGNSWLLLSDDAKEGQDLEIPVGGVDGIFKSGAYMISGEGDEWVSVSVGTGGACLETGTEKKIKECAEAGWSIKWNKEKEVIVREHSVSDVAEAMWRKLNWPVKTEEPELKIIQPSGGQYFKRPEITVHGKTSPGSSIKVNQEDAVVKNDGNFTAEISLYEGENNIVVESRSPSGGLAVKKITVYLDTAPPMLTISQPPDNFDMTLNGDCSSGYCGIQIFGLTEPGVSLQVNGKDMSRYVEDDGSFMIDDFMVRLSERTLTVEAEDSLGQRSVELIYISEPMDMDDDGTPDAMDPCPSDPDCY